MRDTPHVLIVEDSKPLANLYSQYLKNEPIELTLVESGKDAMEAIQHNTPQLVLLDLKLPDMNGQDILQWIRDEGFPLSVIIVTAHGSVDIAVDVMRIGADDFLEKPITASRLRTSVHNLLERTRLKHLVEDIRTTFERDHYHGFIGSSLPMQAVYRIIDSAATSKATVFITGESGTGKEVCAEAIHQQSQRTDKPFVALNCGAIPRDLMESEIFGHVKGAFTGAATDRKGAALQADGGTLFLDEICEMDLDLQTKLLRFIQTGRFQKVGGSKEVDVDIRFICATNKDPLKEVEAGRFREDLYYRLHVIPVHLPPLRNRNDDIIAIGLHFLTQYAQEENKSFEGFSAPVIQLIKAYRWPGNVRQLQNIIRNIVVLHDGERVSEEHLPPPLDSTIHSSTPLASRPMISSQPEPTPKQGKVSVRPLAEIEREAIEQAIEVCDGNIPKAASLLEVSPSTIYRKRQAWEVA
ncbi:MAG: sigma-54 dependent transcriptional regulator [Oceanobacter sp.]